MSVRSGFSRRVLGPTYLLPAVIAIVSGAGLVFALVGDGVWDAASWLGLGFPVAIALWFWQGRMLAPARAKTAAMSRLSS
jgi:hypothetical protein